MTTATRMGGFAKVLVLLLCSGSIHAQNFDVAAQVRLLPTNADPAAHASHRMPRKLLSTVIWLMPLDPASIPAPHVSSFTLAQKNKQFTPHLLVIPVGSTVQFPNQDPFYHNVFSLFNGRRFDLGLYEAGSTRSVRFSREGVSYIFCNIHPEMSAVVLTLATSYFAVVDEHDRAVIHAVPAGQYRLRVWSEGAEFARLDALTRVVQISGNNTNLGLIEIPQTSDLMTHHKNKFGEDYDHNAAPVY
ncbi:MAG TPA: hypothetical protein VM554_14090 [Acidisarcina sp.]|nr:hypothetical protein [Acidisarcina sp.]